ncbi:3D-(3,5/4)-trihydroxycyclohexane-1,2-dione hydrolase [uncultured archaeon]|nr:3D-(3,5/4)-trihydroxycyclohexane-1,2-dione hydrolase [uncultured archaeon]
MKISDYVIDFLIENNIRYIFEVIGGAITHLVDSTYGRKDIACIVTHHEQAAAFAAEAYSRVTSNIGVAMATSGPGATNLITGIGSAYFDSIPCLYITGQVNTYEYKFNKKIRQLGFQETDIVNIVKPITKYACMITEPTSIKYQLQKAIYIAKSGRPGPVLLDIPMNIQRTEINPDELPEFFDSEECSNIKEELKNENDDSKIKVILDLIEHSERPVVLIGGGIRSSGATNELFEFIQKTKIPVVSSLMGLDAFPHDHPLFFGMIGAYGNRYSNLAVANSDLLIVLGSRLDMRQTGTRPETFAVSAKIIHIDIDENELNSKVKSFLSIKSDLKQFLSDSNKKLKPKNTNSLNDWYESIKRYKKKFPSYIFPEKEKDPILPNFFMKYLSGKAADDAIICLDVGQHEMWAAQSFEIKKNQRMIISGGMGSMGFGLPAAIGASLAEPGKQVIAIVGDGGFQMNIQELQTIVRNKLPIKIFLLNNKSLGMVRQFQELYFKKRFLSTLIGYDCPDFTKVVQAYGIQSESISTFSDLKEIITSKLNDSFHLFVEVIIPMESNVDPKLEFNRPIEDQSPYISREQLESLLSIRNQRINDKK